MKRIILFLGFLLTGLLVVLSTSAPLQAAISAEERAALIAFYNATDGDNWYDSSGWKGNNNESDGFSQIGSEGNWFGITVSGGHVTEISMYDNHLNGHIPPELGNLGNLSYLDLGYNELIGSIPPELGNFSNLYCLHLNSNQLSGNIPAGLGNLSNLERLELHQNQLSGSIPAELGNLNNLFWLELASNQLSGSIPLEFGTLSNLKNLNLSNNQLSGSIPSELGNLSELGSLYLSDNQLSGSIPPELGNLSNLSYLDLAYNDLSGSIPPELGNLSNLLFLYLNFNQLSGSIPPELGNLSNLWVLFINSNRLTGNIPSSLANLTSLSFISYYNTDIGYNGLYTNDDTLRKFLSSKDSDWEDTQTTAPANVFAKAISNSSIRVSWTTITYNGDIGGYKVYYSTTSGGPYKYSGMTADKSTSFYDVTGLNPGTTYYLLVNTQTNPHTYNDNMVISEYSAEVSATTGLLVEKDPPFGSFDTPIDGSTVCSSIPVTGWALDDTGIDSIMIYREQEKNLVYIGEVVLVEGARPDVAAAYPDYPNNTRAGWGYMMLTNFLPNGGNGTFVIHAIATDLVGKTTTLGTKTIHCDNANAVKPFGAIDTPSQGGTASGTSFINWGWVLTPQPNSIPTDGSTINVFVDGVNIGYPTYNNYRKDISNLFPGYANSNGAVGYFYLDTTAYENGVHTIQWTARDSGGNSDGIGSRYFSVRNTGTSSLSKQSYQAKAAPQKTTINISQFAHIPVDYSVPVRVKKGFKEDVEPQYVHADDKGFNSINIREVERVRIHLTDRYDDNLIAESLTPNSFSGYLEVNNQLEPLPVGSTMDTQRGIFYWQPGPGFIGEYRFVFIEKGQDMNMRRMNIIVKIVPKFK